ncbi:hypothetical protein EV122DRAFT_284060 [Schizophyllum commune]
MSLDDKIAILNKQPPASSDDGPVHKTYKLFDLRVEVVCPPGELVRCGAKDGDYFDLVGEMISLPPGQAFSLYSLGAMLPLLAGMQRTHDLADWMTREMEVACPDPDCKSRLRIRRLGLRTFDLDNVSVAFIPANASREQQTK